MSRKVYRRIVALVLKAAELARSVGIQNILQPGLVKEMIIADILGHELIISKRAADACDPNDPSIVYEYLTFKEGGSGQFDRMFKEPLEKRKESLSRILRNNQIYFAIFYDQNQTKIKIIYQVNPTVVAEEANRQLDRSINTISHVGFPEKWIHENGEIVYEDSNYKFFDIIRQLCRNLISFKS